jgi:hypothetical protein
VWLHGTGPDVLLDMARLVTVALGPAHDHLTDFTRPVSGAYYFAPSLQALAGLG